MKRAGIAVIVLAIAFAALMSPQIVEGLTGGRAYIADVVAKPGQKVHFDILLNYTATQTLSTITYTLEVRDLPPKWAARTYYDGQEIRSLSIGNGEVALIGLEIDVPATEKPGTYPFIFAAMGKELAVEGIVLGLSVKVEALKRELKLSSDYPDVTIEREGTARFSIILNNFGETDELANLTAEAPDGWGVVFKGQAGGIFGIYLPYGQSAVIQVEAKPPEGVTSGVYDLMVRAQSADEVANATLLLRVAVIKSGTSERMISTLYPELNVEAGKVLFFPLTIRNLGTGSLTYRLSSVSVPTGWDVLFRTTPDEEASSVSSIFLSADESAILYLEANPPATVTIGTYSFTIRATSEEGSSQDLTVTARVTGYYEISLELDTLFARARGGETSTIQATVYNTGASRLTNVSLEVTAPEGWEITRMPNYLDTLAPGEYGTLVLLLKPPNDADVGDYLVGVRSVSDRARSTQFLLRVNVQSSSLGLWAIGITAMAIAGILLAAVYLKFARK